MKIEKVMLLVLLLAFSVCAYAEGRCPPGQYPIGGQGVGGCAPIPGGTGGGEVPSPRATGRWIKTWGAISRSITTGDVGASVGKRAKAEAIAEAQSRCASYGAVDCAVGLTYKNQCAALVAPESGSGGRISMAGGPSKDVATKAAMKSCLDNGGRACVVKYTDCSEPLFEKF
ncbi:MULTISPECIES: DUF4189 domain-containing protein [Stenotrophomonas maltophilia group]|uniref:DUF4189 domain-containing protein n=2 Tax=Stenotrophomonas maltophilia group TaxID=995085 RepID=UPI002AB315AC|nr:DUF4189 domain-containing protein [Stenotrophomonas maltophilia]